MGTLGATQTNRAEEHDDAPLPPGERIDDFVIEGVLGAGGYGTVYAAVDTVLDRPVAIKVLRLRHAAEPRALARFVGEAKIVASLRHPHIVEVFSFGTHDGRAYQVMERLEGPTLAARLAERGRVPATEALPILRAVASALEAMHGAGIAHRDLKPANIMLAERSKLIDFGIAKLLDERARDATASGALLGTPQYMAPEQCRGKKVDARADIYAFGLVAYEMLTGRPPFSGEDALDLMLKHTAHAPPAASSIVPMHPEVDALLASLLAKTPDERPRQLGEVVDRLERALARPPRRRRRALWLAAPALCALPLFAGDPPAQLASSFASLVPTIRAAERVAAPAAADDTVVITIVGAPADTLVRDADGAMLGTAPGAIRLPRGHTPVSLRFDNPGHAPVAIELVPSDHQRIVVALPPAPAPARRAPGIDDPESPFDSP